MSGKGALTRDAAVLVCKQVAPSMRSLNALYQTNRFWREAVGYYIRNCMTDERFCNMLWRFLDHTKVRTDVPSANALRVVNARRAIEAKTATSLFSSLCMMLFTVNASHLRLLERKRIQPAYNDYAITVDIRRRAHLAFHYFCIHGAVHDVVLLCKSDTALAQHFQKRKDALKTLSKREEAVKRARERLEHLEAKHKKDWDTRRKRAKRLGLEEGK